MEGPGAGGGEWKGPQYRLEGYRMNEKLQRKLQQFYWNMLQEGFDQL